MKNKKILYTALSASLLLAACGTDTSEEDKDNQTVESTEQNGDSATDGSETTESGTESTDTTQGDSTNDDEATNDDEGTEEDTSTESGSDTDSDEPVASTELVGATEKESDEQEFKMQVLPDYDLTSEEPGRDILFVKKDEEMFMTIGTSKVSETDYEKAVATMNETLAASSSDATPVELTDAAQLPTNKDLQKVQAFRVVAADGPITAMIFQRDELVVSLMMYDNTDESYYEEYLKMAETIQAK